MEDANASWLSYNLEAVQARKPCRGDRLISNIQRPVGDIVLSLGAMPPLKPGNGRILHAVVCKGQCVFSIVSLDKDLFN